MATQTDPQAAAAMSILSDVLILLEIMSPRCVDTMLAGAKTELDTLRSTTPLARPPSPKIQAAVAKVQALESVLARAKGA